LSHSRARLCLGRRRAGRLETDRDIVERGLPRKQRVGLEEIAGLPVEAGQSRAKDVRMSAGGREQARRHVEKRRLAAAGRTDDGDELAVGDGQARALDRGEDAASRHAEGYRHVVECDGACRRPGRLRHSLLPLFFGGKLAACPADAKAATLIK
jgi:hypothetical protein